jgi:phenylalanyl-tRNA synthetase beta chain
LRISLEWLSDYVDLVVDAAELADKLTNSGTAVEDIEVIGGEFKGFKVGLVKAVEAHPSADRLSVCRVDIGGSIQDIVCGAPNVSSGIKVPVVLPGSHLPDGTLIKKASIRGVTSHGMILSEKELGISDAAEGIMILDDETLPGMHLDVALGFPDTVLVLEVTPNRPDCLSMIGVAREVAALTGKPLRMPRFELEEGEARADSVVAVEILDSDLCSRYVARIIDNLFIEESPWWMRRRLRAEGVRPISNVVDVTNYVMLELGQPLHAFDCQLVQDGRIIVRRAADGEILITLDGVSRQLSRDDLLICDPKGPIALAGVMGGEQTEIGAGTARVLLESAHFDPPNIMRTSRMHDLSSEASYRFERGVDPNGCLYAADRSAFLMSELGGGKVMAGAVDARGRTIDPAHLDLRVRRAGKLIGIPLDIDEAGRILSSIGLHVEDGERKEDGDLLRVEVPTFRPDLEREIDLVEEIARLNGYDRIAATLPSTSRNIGHLTREQRAARKISRVMTGLGLYEAVTQSFISPTWLDTLDPSREYLEIDSIKLRNPISEETSLMRPMLLPGLLDALRFNINRRVTDVFLYEIGRVFSPMPGKKLPREDVMLGCAIVGRWIPKQWDCELENVDFFTAKGILEGLLSAMKVSGWSLREREIPFLHPAQSCSIYVGEDEAGYLGLIHPRLCGEMDLPENTACLEIDLRMLVDSCAETVMFQEIPRFPAIPMDIAVVVANGIASREVEEVIREAGGELLREVRLFDLYRGDQIGEDEKSLAYGLSFYAMDRTLTDDEARAAFEVIVKALSVRLNARIR